MSDESPNTDLQLSALKIYNDLIKSCRKAQSDRYRVHYNELTGIQKIFLDGKLIHIKHVRYTRPEPPQVA